MELVGMKAAQVTDRRQGPEWQAALELQTALFADMLRHGGLAEAFSTGSGPLDSMTGQMLQVVAEDLSRHDQSLAERLYKTMVTSSSKD